VHAHDAPLKLVCSGWRKSFGGEPSTGQMVQCARTWHAHGTSGSIKIGRAGYGRSRGGTLAVDDHVSFRPLRAPGRSGQGSGWFCFAGVVRSRRPKCAPAKGFRQTKPAAPGGPPFFLFFYNRRSTRVWFRDFISRGEAQPEAATCRCSSSCRACSRAPAWHGQCTCHTAVRCRERGCMHV
jgi:hypothetical protein